MNQQVVEYLYQSKEKTTENIEEIFREILSFYEEDNFIYYETQGEKLKFYFNIIQYHNSLHVTFNYSKSGRIGIKEVCIFQSFLEEVNIKASKFKLGHTTLLDTNALFFSKRLLPYLHNYEWSLRKLIYLVSPMYFSENWVKSTFSKETISLMKKKEKGNYDSKNLLQLMDLSDFEDYLFGKNYVKIVGEEESTVRFKEMAPEALVDLFHLKTITTTRPYSLWEEVFNKYMDIELEEIQADMQLIREGRNIVSHNKEIKESLYQDLIRKLKLYINQLDAAFQRILSGNVNDEELNNMADDFEGYIESKWNKIDLMGMGLSTEDTARLTSAIRGSNLIAGLSTEDTTRLTSAIRGSNLIAGLSTEDTARLTSAIRGSNLITGLATEDTTRLTSAIRGSNLIAGLSTENTARLTSAIRGSNLITGLATEDTTRLTSAIRASNLIAGLATEDTTRLTSAIRGSNLITGLTTEDTTRLTSAIRGSNLTGIKLNNENKTREISSQEEIIRGLKK